MQTAMNNEALKPRTGGYQGQWVGRFIWDDGEAHPYHSFMMFRKTFTATNKITLAVLLLRMHRDGRSRWTTTDNEENSAFVHRSRRRSRLPTRTT